MQLLDPRPDALAPLGVPPARPKAGCELRGSDGSRGARCNPAHEVARPRCRQQVGQGCPRLTIRAFNRPYPPTYSFAPVWPTAIFLVAAGAICAGLVEQSLPDILPEGM